MELTLSVLAIALTLAAVGLFARDVVVVMASGTRAQPWSLLRLGVFLVVVLMLLYGSLVYHLMRVGFFLRLLQHRPAAIGDLLAARPSETAPALAILVPAYKEDPRTIQQTLLSAALQQYPRRRVVLLIDDPPAPPDQADADQVAAVRRVPEEVSRFLREPAARVKRAAGAFTARRTRHHCPSRGTQGTGRHAALHGECSPHRPLA
jgi:cellulose synthase/poly-beta-1,6-N-acetylglucosamine synthase-like glycosyltransferase